MAQFEVKYQVVDSVLAGSAADAKLSFREKNPSAIPTMFTNKDTEEEFPVEGICIISGLPIFYEDEHDTDTQGNMWLKEYEPKHMTAMDAMCVESLTPDLYSQWEKVAAALRKTRKHLKDK